MTNLRAFFKFALKELWNNRRFSLLFCAQLSLGLAALGVVDGLRDGVQTTLNERSKSLLGADLSVGARRPLTEAEKSTLGGLLPTGARQMESIEAFTMMASGTASRLVELKGIEPEYPYYGEIELRHGGVVQGSSDKDLFLSKNIWITPELALQLKLERGDDVRIGGQDFTVTDIVERDASSVGTGFSFAPTVYLALDSLLGTDLIRPGATGFFEFLYLLPAGTDITKLADAVNETLTDPAIRVKLPDKASEQVGRGLSYVTDYLGLSTLVALFIAGLGLIYLLKRYLYVRRPLVGTLKSIGVRGTGIFAIYFFEILFLGLGAAGLAVVISAAVLPALSPIVRNAANIDVQLSLGTPAVATILLVSTAFALMLALPHLLRFKDTRPNWLFQPDTGDAGARRYLIWYTPAVLLTFALAVWISRSFKTGTLFFAAFWGSFAILSGLGFALFRVAARFPVRFPLARIVVRQILSQRGASLGVFVTLSVAFALTCLIPQLKEGLRSELETPTGVNQPSLFLFDIQDEQVEPLEEFIESQGGRVMQSSPMIRARLELVNGEPFRKRKLDEAEFTREEENENRFRNRGFNLTYRQKLSESERMIKGRPFTENLDDSSLPEISLEERFAQRLDLGLGDTLTFDIQGIPVEGLVVNLRKVRWTSFQPNFFIQFSEGILRDAPKTHIMTLAAMDLEEKANLQSTLVERYPNVSIIDVSKLIERLSGMLGQMSATLQALALVTLAVGAFILFTIATFVAQERKADVALMKAIGVRFGRIRNLFVAEFALLAFISAIAGIAVSLLLAFVLSHQLFDGAIGATWFEWSLVLVGGVLTAAAITGITASRTLARATIDALRER